MNFKTLKEIGQIKYSFNRENIEEKIQKQLEEMKDPVKLKEHSGYLFFLSIPIKHPFQDCFVRVIERDEKHWECIGTCHSATHPFCGEHMNSSFSYYNLICKNNSSKVVASSVVDTFESFFALKICPECLLKKMDCRCENCLFLTRDEKDNCPVCLKELKLNSHKLNCEHELCLTCYIDLMVTKNNNCPLCRSIICQACEEDKLN